MKRLKGLSINKKRGRRILAVLMSLLIMVGMLPLSSLTVFSVGGTLTKDGSVYLIYDKADLKAFASKVNKGENAINGKLMADITLNENAVDIDKNLVNFGYGLEKWLSIGNAEYAYEGTFDGNNQIIKGMYIMANGSYHGLFGNIGTAGVVKNIGLVDGYVQTSAENENHSCGGICGENNGTITQCYNANTIENRGKWISAGGICGKNKGNIERCFNSAKIVITGNSGPGGTASGSAGVCGFNRGGKLENCYNTGEITNIQVGYIGGVCGLNRYVDSLDPMSGAIINCYNKGKITNTSSAESNIGGVCGRNESGNINNSYNTAEIKSQYDANNRTGGVSGYNGNGNMTNCYNVGTVLGANDSTGGLIGFIPTTIPSESKGVITGSYYLDSSCITIQTPAIGLTQTTTEMKDPTFTTLLNTGAVPAPFINDVIIYESLQNDGYPIFGYQIKIQTGGGTQENPYQIRTADELKMFADLVNGGSNMIHGKLMKDIALNTNLINSSGDYIIGSYIQWTPIGNVGHEYKGIFDGNEKKITGLYINSSDLNLGLFGIIATEGVVKKLGITYGYVNCFGGGSNPVGGLCGENKGIISGCYNKNTVNSNFDGVSAGGICGLNSNGSLENCYNTGVVGAADSQVGGVCGNNSGSLKNCYNIGSVIGTIPFVGGLCGSDTGTITNCYYLELYGNNNKGTPKSETEMKLPEFVNTLNTDAILLTFGMDTNSLNKDFPVLVFKTKIANGEGTITAPYQITTASEMRHFATLINSGQWEIHGILMNDITLNTNVLDSSGNLNGDGSDFEPWIAIGNSSDISGDNYKGTFDGNGKVIKGIYMDSDELYQGLFASIDTVGMIKNLGIVDSYIKGSNTYNRVGSFCGYNSGTITNCYNKGTVKVTGTTTDKTCGGGISGYNNHTGKIENCFNLGKIMGTGNNNDVGGISGRNYGIAITGGIINNCFNTGVVTTAGSGNFAGGISATNVGAAKITNSYYLNTYGDNALGTPKAKVYFENGEVTYLLNGDQATMLFGQRIGTDLNPQFIALDESNRVFRITYTGDYAGMTYVTKGKDVVLPTPSYPETQSYTFAIGNTIFYGPSISADATVIVTATTKTVAPTVTPIVTPVIKPVVKPVVKPVQKPATKPGVVIGVIPGLNPEVTPDEEPDEIAEVTPDETIEVTPDENPEVNLDKTPGEKENADDNSAQEKSDKGFWIFLLVSVLVVSGGALGVLFIVRKKII